MFLKETWLEDTCSTTVLNETALLTSILQVFAGLLGKVAV